MDFTFVDAQAAKKRGPVTVKPYFDSRISNMGLEKYGMALYDGVYHEEQLACIENNGIKRYVTGLNEFAPEIKLIKDVDVREARVKEIRNIISELERDLASNMVEPSDPEFWNKIKLLKPDNHEFWSKITMRCGNEPIFLDPVKDPYDLIKLCAIEAGGFSIISKSYEDAKSRARAPKFYLDKLEDTVSTKTEGKKIRNKAISELQKLYDKNTNKLFYVAKVVDPASSLYKKSTPNDIIYDNMDKHIMGEGSEQNSTRAAKAFLDASAMDMETLKLKAIVKDATYYKILVTKADGMIYEKSSGTMMGRNIVEVVEYMKNPLNEVTLLDITKKVEKFWNSQYIISMATKKGLYANIHAKRARIKAGSGETMRKPGTKDAPTKQDFIKSAKTAKKK